MTRKKFISMYKTLSTKSDAKHFARHLFRAFDLDRSNSVDFREFLIGVSMTSTSTSPQMKLEWIFQVFDIDGNGLLTRNECLEVIDTIVRFYQSQSSDKDKYDIEDLVESAKQSMMKIFDNVAIDGCETLTMLQFVDECQKNELISQLLTPNSSTGNE
jgi:Ca2+-binding EF-hand superfamily protein